MIYMGVSRDLPVAWQMGCSLLFIIFALTVGVKLFPQHLDSKESGEEALKVMKHAAKQIARNR